MKTLTKIKLINWHGFYNDTIDIKGSILVTGENGSGKSTLLDAVYFLLSGGEENKFNSAANEKANRTLETYMRGKTGVEGRAFLREDPNLVSHIAMEFFDNLSKERFLIGVVLEIQEGRNRLGRSFYHIKNRAMDDSLFLRDTEEGKAVINFKEMKKSLKENEYSTLEGNKEDIRRKFLQILNLENNRYYELLPKALAFKPIPDVNDFVYQFLMPEKNVQIEGLRSQIHTYNEIQRIIREDSEKKTVLEQMIESGNRREEVIDQAKAYEAYAIHKDLAQSEALLVKYKDEKKSCDIRLAEINADQASVSENKQQLEETIRSIENSAGYERMRDLQEKEAAFEDVYDENEAAQRAFNQRLSEEAAVAEALSIKQNFLSYIKGSDFAGLCAAISAYQPLYDQKVSATHEERSRLKQQIEEKRSRQKGLESELSDLRKGVSRYPEEVEVLLDLLSPIVRDIAPESRPIPLCELIDIEEGEGAWRNAIEAILGKNRFSIFVPESCFEQCFEAYVASRKEKNISGVGLVNVTELRDEACLDNSLAKKITTSDPRARRYVDHLLGKIVAKPASNDVLSEEFAVTDEVFSHADRSVRQYGRKQYTIPYIGRESRKIRIASLQEEINSLTEQVFALESEVAKRESLLRKAREARYANSLPEKDIWAEFKRSKADLEEVRRQLEAAKSSVGELAPQVDSLKVELEKACIRLAGFDKEKEKQLERRGAASSHIEEEQRRVEEKRRRKEELSLTEKVQSLLDVLLNEGTLSISEANGKTVTLNKNANKIENEIVASMQDYVRRFGFDASPNLDSYQTFLLEYNDVVMRNLDRHIAQLEEARKNASEMFQNSYIADIRKRIREEEENIKKLNKVLENKPFGYDGETYQFVISRSQDANFGQYYDIFRSNEQYSATDLFTTQLSEKNFLLMQDLFRELTVESDDPKQARLIEDYTDYRKFMSYDIIIRNSRGDVSYFSKINREKSGGETQTPFYVIIAASFDQIIRGGYGQRSPGCIVMLDEAFNNMDESHIDSMMQYFSQLYIQPIIAVPTQRAKTIMPYIDTTIGLVKINDRVYPTLAIKEDK